MSDRIILIRHLRKITGMTYYAIAKAVDSTDSEADALYMLSKLYARRMKEKGCSWVAPSWYKTKPVQQ